MHDDDLRSIGPSVNRVVTDHFFVLNMHFTKLMVGFIKGTSSVLSILLS